jgi:3'-phosphoadenosine 5'-phosphosulfate sulfotransferase (PAPS reductase)/FAD synthetase
VALGLRSEESGIRRRVREMRGRCFRLASGQLRCLPVADWSGLDVFAYAHSRNIELLPVYRCVALMHAREPWLIRKSWWLPGSHAAQGGVVWLRRYYPSLYDKMCALFGDTWQYT